ncbi:TPA: hypothetical protein N2C09_005545 [Pseudomonas aeruginosa]|nr:hypothetical protein [Pseudomonas aeruginosa]
MPTISFRVSEAQKIEVEERAQGDVSEYVRKVLFEHFDQEDALHQILDRLDERPAGGDPATGEIDPAVMAIQLELLLLMRSVAKPDTLREAQAEVERLGFKVWESTKRV